METIFSSFLYAGGPLFVVCFILGWTPYFCHFSEWNDANYNDPIKLSLKSSLYRYALVAGISASFPPCLELIFYVIVARGNSIKPAILILANMFIFISPELISLILVSPSSDSKLYFLLLNNRISALFFFAILLLCHFSEKSWKCKLSTVTATLIYAGLLINSLAPYLESILGIWIHKFGSILQIIGCILFVIKSYKFLFKRVVTKESEDFMIMDNLLCKFITLSVLFIIISIVCVNLSAGIPYWTERNSTYITSYTIILALPNVLMGVAFAHATRNETVYLQHAKQMFVNYISHEMRTPLNTAVMGLQYLRSELVKAEANDEIMLTLDEVRTACETSVSILTEMLDFDKLQSGLMKMELEDLSVRDFLEDTISPFYVQAGLKDIVLEWNFDSPAMRHLFVSADKSKFAQVIRNLLSNALKFTPTGGTVTITTTVTPYSSSASSSHKASVTGTGTVAVTPSQLQLLTIEVTDTGAGISKENQKKLFNKMVQFNPGKLQSGGGTGLGLYISKGIMDLLQGTLSVKSEGEGHGCTFTVTTLAKYIDNTNNEILEYKEDVEDNEKANDKEEERIAIRVGSSESTRTHGSVLEISAGRFPNSRRKGSIRSIGSGTSKVTPLLKTDSIKSCTTASISGLISQDDSYDGNTTSGSSSKRRNPLKVLLVDDSRSNRKMLVRLLRSRCSVIGEAVDGVDAVTQIKAMAEEGGGEGEQRPYDAILMDFVMPNMEGPEAAREIRELGYQGLIIGITGNVLTVDKERFISQGANIVLTKPVNLLDILTAFDSLLPTKKPRVSSFDI